MRSSRKIMIISSFLALLLVGTTFAATLWSSDPFGRTITIAWGSAMTIETTAFDSYLNKISPTELEELPDVRSDTFAIVLLDTIVTDDLLLTVDVTGAPAGAVVTTKMSWACFQQRIEDPLTSKITAFNTAGVGYLIKANGDYMENIDSSTFTLIPESGLLIANADLPLMTYSTPEVLNVPVITDSNALWVWVDIDTSGIVGYGTWDLEVVASIVEV